MTWSKRSEFSPRTDRDGDGVLEKDGRPFTFDFVVISGNIATHQLGQMLQAEWKKIGIDVQIVILDGAAAIQRVIAGSYDAAYLAWDLDPDPDPTRSFTRHRRHRAGRTLSSTRKRKPIG